MESNGIQVAGAGSTRIRSAPRRLDYEGTALEKAALKHLHYGPPGIHNVKIPGLTTATKEPIRIQLDRVQQVWSLNVMWQGLGLDLTDQNTVLIEFGGGTGQMADMPSCVGFGGRHVVYDFTVMALMQVCFLCAPFRDSAGNTLNCSTAFTFSLHSAISASHCSNIS